ncbi:hypothetical protein COBT_003023 [Conglomerata obtusa]
MFSTNENKSSYKNIIIGLMLLPELVELDVGLFDLNKLTALNTKITEISEACKLCRDKDNKKIIYEIIYNNDERVFHAERIIRINTDLVKLPKIIQNNVIIKCILGMFEISQLCQLSDVIK